MVVLVDDYVEAVWDQHRLSCLQNRAVRLKVELQTDVARLWSSTSMLVVVMPTSYSTTALFLSGVFSSPHKLKDAR